MKKILTPKQVAEIQARHDDLPNVPQESRWQAREYAFADRAALLVSHEALAARLGSAERVVDAAHAYQRNSYPPEPECPACFGNGVVSRGNGMYEDCLTCQDTAPTDAEIDLAMSAEYWGRGDWRTTDGRMIDSVHIVGVLARAYRAKCAEAELWESDARAAQANWHTACNDLDNEKQRADRLAEYIRGIDPCPACGCWSAHDKNCGLAELLG